MRTTKGPTRGPRWFDNVGEGVWLTVIGVLLIAIVAGAVILLDYAELSFFLPIRSP